jgi:hypothetical protein
MSRCELKFFNVTAAATGHLELANATFQYHNDCTNSCYTCPLTLTPSGAVAHSLSVT